VGSESPLLARPNLPFLPDPKLLLPLLRQLRLPPRFDHLHLDRSRTPHRFRPLLVRNLSRKMGENRFTLLEMDPHLFYSRIIRHHYRPHYRSIRFLQRERLWVEHDFDHGELDFEFRSFSPLD